MRSTMLAILAVSVTIAASGGLVSVSAQQAPISPDPQTEMCVRWVNSTALPSMLNPNEFCAGVKGNKPADAWYTLKCGSNPRAYCQTIARMMPADTLAVNVRAASKDGHEFLQPSSNAPVQNNSKSANATIYSRTDFTIENLQLKAGVYEIIPSQVADGWKLTILKPDVESREKSGIPQAVGTVNLRKIALDDYPMDILRVQLYAWARHCPGPELTQDARELEFSFANTAFSLCIRPDQVAPVAPEQLSKR